MSLIFSLIFLIAIPHTLQLDLPGIITVVVLSVLGNYLARVAFWNALQRILRQEDRDQDLLAFQQFRNVLSPIGIVLALIAMKDVNFRVPLKRESVEAIDTFLFWVSWFGIPFRLFLPFRVRERVITVHASLFILTVKRVL